MPNNPQQIDRYEDCLQQLIYQMHKDGISYLTIGFVLSEAVKNLDLMAYCEKWLAEYTTDKGLVTETL